MDNTFGDEEAETVTPHIYRHKTIRKYMVGNPQEVGGIFMFHDYELLITEPTQAETDARNEKFVELMKRQPRSERLPIVKINLEARAAAEVGMDEQIGSTVIRGTAQVDDILTAEDRAKLGKIQSNQAPATAALGAGLPAAGGPKPYVPGSALKP